MPAHYARHQLAARAAVATVAGVIASDPGASRRASLKRHTVLQARRT